MEKKALKKLSLRKEAISRLQPGTQARILGGGSNYPCYNSANDPCDTEMECLYTRTPDADCNPYVAPESAVQTALPSICDKCPRPTFDCDVI